jgi:protein tyrosine phosphatase (PTP) superfamily phosphohydrolase (DUF442 family)
MEFKNQIPNYYTFSEKIATGAQPKPDAFKALKENGFDTVLNLSPESTPNFLLNED